jgi:hypothetical protein
VPLVQLRQALVVPEGLDDPLAREAGRAVLGHGSAVNDLEREDEGAKRAAALAPVGAPQLRLPFSCRPASGPAALV